MLFTGHYLLLLSSFAFQTLLTRVITLLIYIKRMIWPVTSKKINRFITTSITLTPLADSNGLTLFDFKLANRGSWIKQNFQVTQKH